MLRIEHLTGGWGQTTIVEDLNIAVAEGEVVSIVGRNGVGKSTTLEVVMGRARRHAGAVHFNGREISALPVYERSRLGLGYVPQAREVFPSLTVLENLSIAARPGFWNRDTLMDLFPSLARRTGSLGGQLSGGEQQMLSVARALIGNPSLLLMDEPTEGLAPIVVEQMVEALRRLADTRSMAILLVEQVVEVALDLSSRCLVMERGRLIHEAPSAELRQQPERLHSLLGFEG
jgi:branched-chain amino acid transport system ATP-binding protein